MNWIDVKKEPPKNGSDFLGTDGEIIFAAYWVKDCDDWKVGGWESCCYCGGASAVSVYESIYTPYTAKKVTHWMSLPEKPRG